MKRRAIAMVAALALAGGACGGDDDGDVTDDAGAASDESSADAASGDENDDSGGDSGGSGWCEQLEDTEFDTPQFDDLDINDPESVENAFQEIIDLIEEAADSAPDEIEADVEILVDQSKEFFDALEEADFNFAEIDTSALETPEADAAAERIDEFCGFDDDTGETGDTGDTGDTIDVGELGDVGDISGTDLEVAREQMVSVFTLMGMTDEQANCVVDNIDLENLDELENVDPAEYFDLFDDCGFDLANPGG